jgi:hypothetical protein
MDHSNAAVTDNVISGAARTNQATLAIAPDALAYDDHYGPTSLTAGLSGATANSATVIANRQSTTDTLTYGDIVGSTIGLNAGTVSDSRLALTGNTQEGIASGNDASARIVLAGTSTDSGAGIAHSQTAGQNSVVGAQARGLFTLRTASVSTSNLANSSNLDRAIAYGNAVDNGVSATIGAVTIPAGSGDASTVPTDVNGDPRVSAAFGILTLQGADGTVRARVGDVTGAPAINTSVGGNLASSSVATDKNALTSAAYGNQSANGLVLDAISIIGAPVTDGPPRGAVMNVTSVQRANGAAISATSQGGVATNVHGPVSGSAISTSEDSIRTAAVANLASGNRLVVSAGTIDAQAPNLAGEPGGAALIKGSGSLNSNAAFSVQNAQDYGSSSIVVSQTGSTISTTIDGTVDRSDIRNDGNLALAAGTGNGATNSLAIDATSMRTTAAVNNLQSGKGDIITTLGSANLGSGASIHIGGATNGSTLSTSRNGLTGIAIGQTGANSLAVSANHIANGGGSGGASGSIGTSYGANGTVALSSNQRLGMPSNGETPPTVISSSVFGETGLSSIGTVDGSLLSVDDNVQRANALGNTSLNRLTVATAALDSGVGSALSSYQYGQANVAAVSTMHLATPISVTASSLSLTGNANRAFAVINDAGNMLEISASHLAEQADNPGIASSGQIGPPRVTADHALTGQQFAAGAIRADATTTSGNNRAAGIDGSWITVRENVTSAEAAANRALNAASVAIGADGQASLGLVNTQTSIASVTASARADNGLNPKAPGSGALTGSTIVIRGNAASALAQGNAADNSLALTGVSFPSGSDAAAYRYSAAADAQIALVNIQTNYAPVIATAVDTSFRAPLNGLQTTSQSTIGISDNSIAANAYGNVASNRVAGAAFGQSPGAAIATLQTNYAAVSAQVTGPVYRSGTGPLNAIGLSITGNQLAAAALGNQATNLIASPR